MSTQKNDILTFCGGLIFVDFNGKYFDQKT